MTKTPASVDMLKSHVDFLNQHAAAYTALADRLERARSPYATDTRLEAPVLVDEARKLLAGINSVKLTYEDLVARRDHILEDLARRKRKAEAAEAKRGR